MSQTWSTMNAMQAVSPKLKEITGEVLFGDVWERTALSKRERSMITVAALAALYRTDQLRGHIERALDHGVTKEEIGEIILHMAFYAGWPTAANGSLVAQEVFQKDGKKPGGKKRKKS